MSDLAQLEGRALQELGTCADEAALRAWNTRYFGKQGHVHEAVKHIGKVPAAERKAYGQQANQIKERLLKAYDEADSVSQWAELNRRFHLALCAPANNTRLRRLIEEYGLNTDRYTHEMMSQATGKEGPQSDHYRIQEACRQQDGALAASLVEAHIIETKKNLVAMHRMRQDG